MSRTLRHGQVDGLVEVAISSRTLRWLLDVATVAVPPPLVVLAQGGSGALVVVRVERVPLLPEPPT